MDKRFLKRRDCGYYWCYVKSIKSMEVCYWNGLHWQLSGSQNAFYDRQLVIDEEIIKCSSEKLKNYIK